MEPRTASARVAARPSALFALPAALLLAAVLVRTAAPPPVAAADDPPADDPWDISSQSSYSVRAPDGSRVFAFQDDVVIVHGDLVANCDRAEYLDSNRVAILSGHVVMTQDSTVVRGPVATYDRDRGVARFPSGVLVERPSGTVVGDRGWWWRAEDRFELREHVAAADTSGTLDANAMTYDAVHRMFWAIGDARMVDDESGVTVEGQSLRYDQAVALATAGGEPFATFADDDSTEIRVTGDEITYDPRRNIAVAKGNVHVRRETMEATSGIVRFERNQNRVIFRESPVIVDGRTEIRGERIELEMPGGGVRIVRVKGAAQVSSGLELPGGEDAGPVPVEVPPAAGPLPPEEAGPAPAPPDGSAPAPAPGDEPGRGPVPPGEARERVKERAQLILEGAGPVAAPDVTVPEPAVPGAASAAVDSTLRAAEVAAAADSTADGKPDTTPAWLKIPGEQLPRRNLLFGEEITITFRDDELETVTVIGHGRSKFFPSEESGDLSEWNDVVGDTLHVWFTESDVDSVTVLGHGVGEYRLPAGENAAAPAEELRKLGKLVEYEAPVIRYNRISEMMHLEEGAKVSYKTMVLRSGDIAFDPTKEVMVASGDPSPVLVDQADEIRGEEMRYHLESQKGEIVEGRTKFENAFYQGDDVWKVGDDVMMVEGAVFTTCELEQPHYHFSSKEMKIYLDDKVVAKPVVLRIREIPVFALPFYMASLKKGRHSGFLLPNLELGVDDNRGRFIRNLGYYWAPNDYADATLTFDFYPSQDRVVSYLNTRYNVRYRFNGRVGLKYNRDVPQNRKDTVLELSHQQTVSETMSISADAQFLSSQNVYRDIDDARRLDRDLRSHLTLTKRFPGSNRSLRAELERRENLDTGAIDETLPAITFSQPSRPIGRAPERDAAGGAPGRGLLQEIYYSLDSRFVSERSKQPLADSTGASFLEERNSGAKANTTVRTTQSFGPYLRISPAVNGETVWVDEDRRGRTNATRATYSTSVTASTNLYGTILRPVGPAQGLRHVVEPSVSWNWAPEFREYFYVEEGDTTGRLQDRFESFGGIGGTQRETNRMSFSLRNLVQTKLGRGDVVRRYDLFTLRNSISYDFLAEEAGRKPLSNLSSSLNVLSALPVNQSWTVTHDPYSWELLGTSVTTRASISSRALAAWWGGRPAPEGEGAAPAQPGDGAGDAGADGDIGVTSSLDAEPARGGRGGEWSIDATHTAQRARTGSLSSSVVLNSMWYPTDKWSVRFNTQYDLRTGENTSQSWSVHRTVHCWEISFDRQYLGGEWQYYLRVNVTDLPDIQAERGDRFRGRRGTGTSLDTLF